MKAVRYHQYGDSGVLSWEDAPRPVPGAGQVLVQVAGASFNPVDVGLRMGVLRDVYPLTFPHVPGLDVAGTIVEVGAGVARWQVGDTVVAPLSLNEAGAMAEYALAPAGALAAAPRTVDLADAAALPMVALTARQALFEHGGLTAGQTILVNGAGGAVGGYAVQFAARAGAVVTATASARSADRVRRHGADRVVDYTATPVTEAVAERFDVVLNLVRTSPEETAALAGLVADGGTFLSTTTPVPENTGRGVRVAQVYVRGDGAQLADLVARVDAGELHIDVAARRPMTEVAAVHDEALRGELAGKTVLLP